MSKEDNKSKYAEVYGGPWIGMLPLVSMIIAIAIFSVLGMNSMQNFWCAGLIGMVAGLFIYKDKNRYLSAMMKGVGNSTICMLVLLFIIVGVLSEIFTESHLVDALVYYVSLVNMPPAIFPLIAFLMGALISVATGSSTAALSALFPVLFPMGVQLGCSAALMTGAILSGSLFGDNLAPISDTTITSAATQEAEISSVVRTRFRYSSICGIASIVLYLVFGFLTTEGSTMGSVQGDATYASSILFLIIPVVMVIMILKGANFMVCLLVSDLVGMVMLVLYGHTSFAGLFTTDGTIITGISSMLNTIIFMIMIFVVLSLIQEAGALEKFQNFITKFARQIVRLKSLPVSSPWLPA